MIKNKLFMLSLLLLASGLANSYEVETHREISRKAALVSTLSSRLPDFGLIDLDSSLPSKTHMIGSFGSKVLTCQEDFITPISVSIIDLIRLGAFCEDVTFGDSAIDGFRYINHFYDPAHGGRGFSGGTYRSSRVWGLENTDIGGQNFSYRDARAYFYKGLTLPTKEDRDANLAKTFRSIGHVIHLIEDLAQPQHTRDDPHGSGSLYEQYTDKQEVRTNLPFNGYGPVQITIPDQLWDTNDLKGLAKFFQHEFCDGRHQF